MTIKQKGFTLIELLVVIAIIGILAAVVLASLNQATDRGRDASAQTSLSQARAQAQIYFTDNNSYGTGDASVATDGTITHTTDAGMCGDADIEGLLTAFNDQTGTAVECQSNSNNFTVYGTLNNENIYCVDNTGFAGTVDAAPGASQQCDTTDW